MVLWKWIGDTSGGITLGKRRVGRPTITWQRSRYRSIRIDIHNNLKDTVANGYLNRSYNGGRNYAKWKTYFRRNFCNLPIHEDCNATRDLAYLERKGLIKVGEYDVLVDVFRKIDERAIEYIEKKTSDIKAVGKDVRKKKWARLRVLANPAIFLEEQEKVFSELFQAIADHMKHPHWSSDFQAVTRMSNIMADKSDMNNHLAEFVNSMVKTTSHLRNMTDDVIHKFVIETLNFATSLRNDFGFAVQKIRSKCVDFYGEFAKDPDQQTENKLRDFTCAEISTLLSLAGFSKNELNLQMDLHYFPRDIYDKIIEHWDFYHHTMHLQRSKDKTFMSQDFIHRENEKLRSPNPSRASSRFK
ncbi:uncharacterized protein LOC133198126 [Saccostrea echinata]|uniref:uncharacterized protein LOC133198126 n=1 Tax=Saccostrea echinata TaxID=191078 RepID=UPI002A80E9EF|nr:uncharacterized protein LOC133198126 [Saccostrea echinata]